MGDGKGDSQGRQAKHGILDAKRMTGRHQLLRAGGLLRACDTRGARQNVLPVQAGRTEPDVFSPAYRLPGLSPLWGVGGECKNSIADILEGEGPNSPNTFGELGGEFEV